ALGFKDLAAQHAAAGNAVREPACELLHAPDGVALGALVVALQAFGQIVVGGAADFRVLRDFVHQSLEVVADHAVAVHLRRPIVTANAGRLLRRSVLGDLAEDPRIRRRRATDHDGVAAGGVDHRGRIFGRTDVAIADDRNLHGILDRGNVLPARVAGVAVFAGACV